MRMTDSVQFSFDFAQQELLFLFSTDGQFLDGEQECFDHLSSCRPLLQGSGGLRNLEDEEAREEVLVRPERQIAAQDMRTERFGHQS